MKILVAGSFKSYVYEESCSNAFERLGCKVIRFPWQKYYGSGILFKIQQKLLAGPGIYRINHDLLCNAVRNKPDAVFVNRGVPIWSSTLQKIKKNTDAFLVSNNNDDPFGKQKGQRLWKHFVNSIPVYDFNFVYRSCNIPEYFNHGAKHAEVLMPYFDPQIHYPLELNERDYLKYKCDVIFIGNAKNDNRLNFFELLAKSEYKFNIYGLNWDRLIYQNTWLKEHCFSPIWEFDYTCAIRSAKLALVFFSKGNRDTYTRRSFEIPAIGTCMVSERTDDMMRLFRENKEAVYFSSPEEMVEKINWLLKDDNSRKEIAERALTRVKEINASVDDRMKQVLLTIKQ